MEITRKWLPKSLPDLSQIKAQYFERYFLFIGEYAEVRIQKMGEQYYFERKVEKTKLVREDNIIEITEEEFLGLKKLATKAIIREIYKVQEKPLIEVKIYQGDYQGLVRIEVEFATETEAKAYEPLAWFGREITGTKIGSDGKLIKMDREEFEKEVEKLGV
ncbi:MAG: hypothetical protein WCJ58_03065 [bacterium]